MSKFRLFSLSLLCIVLTGCPYLETYVYQGEVIKVADVKIRPVVFYYHRKKDSVSCDIVLSITNNAAKTQIFNYGKSFLDTGDDTLWLNGIYHGNPVPLPPGTDIKIGAGADSSFGLAYNGRTSQFKQQLRLNLIHSNADTVIVYQRIR